MRCSHISCIAIESHSLHIGFLRFSSSPLPATTRSIKERGNYRAASNSVGIHLRRLIPAGKHDHQEANIKIMYNQQPTHSIYV